MASYDADGGQLDDTRIYFLHLRKIWKNSLEHKEDAFHYDKEWRVAVCSVMEDAIHDEEGNESYEVYFKTDMEKLPRLII